ncbi:HSF-type DNA-binding-domain-containing protein [Pyronema domesticum]|nr:HSF-type DNA-binding-domain-containing protein [Pyronema domesticum]
MANAPPGPTPQQQSLSLGNSTGVQQQQPKVQTAFIHKLYNMLEDNNIQHLISWSPTNESFVVSPTGEFSKVLSQYFKHTNISSFVRQLNMYGFHKVNDVFHTGSPDSTLWEFKHGNGSFKRGDLVGLREIKRRASRHALIHRDSFSGTKSAAVSAPGTPNEQPPDSIEARLQHMEQNLFDVQTRLSRAEENNQYLSDRCRIACEGFSRCHQFSMELTNLVSRALPDVASTVRRDLEILRTEIARHSHSLEEPPRDPMRDAPTFAATLVDERIPLSPRQRPLEDDSRRSSFSGPQSRPGGGPGYFRQPAPPRLQQPPSRLHALGSGSPNSLRPQREPTAPIPHPLSNLQSQSPPSHMARRHTSADIRQHGWQVNSPFSGIGQTPHWPPSPSKHGHNSDYRDSYERISERERIERNDRGGDMMREMHTPRPSLFASQITPPLQEVGNTQGDGVGQGWNFGKFQGSLGGGHTAPPTRRPSLAASSVHALLNPSEPSSERDGSDGEQEERKRKRIV